MIVFVNITKPRVTWERILVRDSLHWAGSWAGLWGIVLSELAWEDPVHCRRRHSLSRWSWTAVEWGNWLTHKQVGMPAFLPAPLWVWCCQRLHATVTVASPQWWMEFRLWALINPFPTQLLIARVTYHSNGNGSGMHRKSYSCFLRFFIFFCFFLRNQHIKSVKRQRSQCYNKWIKSMTPISQFSLSVHGIFMHKSMYICRILRLVFE